MQLTHHLWYSIPMMNGETILSGTERTCPDCRESLVLDVHRSAAGYYIGTFCACGPYSRESGYFSSREEAIEALVDLPSHARNCRFVG